MPDAYGAYVQHLPIKDTNTSQGHYVKYTTYIVPADVNAEKAKSCLLIKILKQNNKKKHPKMTKKQTRYKLRCAVKTGLQGLGGV